MAFHYLSKALEWLHPIIYAAGLFITLKAFRCTRVKAFLALAFYFVAALFAMLAMPHINRALDARRAPEISAQAEAKMARAIDEAVQRVMTDEGLPAQAHKEELEVPVGPALLVFGIWLLARREQRRQCISTSHEPMPPR
jgi:hypothetical protein